MLAIDRGSKGRQLAIVCHCLPILELWVFAEESRHSIDYDTSSVSANDQILDEIVWRNNLQNVIKAESWMALPELILYL